MAISFASQHTASFPPLLRQLGGAVLVSTYQAGQLIILRDQGSESLNTHFCAFDKPMGLVADQEKLVVGTGFQVWELRNLPAVAPKVEPLNRHDACYLPRQVHVTGDIDIHEMAFGEGDELWLVNTRLSCLCTLDKVYSVVPRWRPPFVSAYDLTDRCHLNGLALKNGQPAFVTALGATDASEGWRANKAKGGVLLEVPSGRVIAEALSMPHSPRWQDNQLWYLESGAGRLCRVDPNTGRQDVIAELPGFTRGLDLVGRYAFVGLSQVRETAVFSGLPLTARVAERQCGVWVVDTEQRRIVACVVFTGAVREIFAVQVLPWRFPALLDMGDPLVRSSYSLPDAALQEIAPVDPLQAQLEQATAVHRQGDYEQAITRYRELLNIRPEHLTARYQLGLALVDAECWAEAEPELRDVVTRQPQHAEAHNSLGVSYMERKDDDRALHHFEQAITADRQYAIAHFNRSLALLKLGDYRQGWEEYDWRWQMPTFTPFECPQPLWRGEDIHDKILLVHSEQGHGDAIQFARFLPLAAQRCKKLIVACTEPLRTLFTGIPGVAETRLAGSIPLDSFEVYCPLLSLPRALEITLDNLPARTPYLSVPDHVSVPALANDGRLRVGLVWAGSRTYKKDHHRSCPLDPLIGLFSIFSVAWYSLQKPLTSAENALLETHSVCNLEPELTDYARTAAYVQQLDLIISVDTSVAHLAASLAKPVWVLLAQNADWRWLQEREDSPWYPTVRLFRQTATDDWAELIERVREALCGTPALQDFNSSA